MPKIDDIILCSIYNLAKERTRECNDPETQFGGIPCHGDDIQIISCNTQNCPIDGNWGTWSSWHGCTVSCGGGTQTSTRQCNDPPVLFGGQECPGDDERTQNCNEQNCPSKKEHTWVYCQALYSSLSFSLFLRESWHNLFPPAAAYRNFLSAIEDIYTCQF